MSPLSVVSIPSAFQQKELQSGHIWGHNFRSFLLFSRSQAHNQALSILQTMAGAVGPRVSKEDFMHALGLDANNPLHEPYYRAMRVSHSNRNRKTVQKTPTEEGRCG
jgi:hypothetical protein